MILDISRYILLTKPGSYRSWQCSGHDAMMGYTRNAIGHLRMAWVITALLAASYTAAAQDNLVVSVESVDTSSSAHPEVAVDITPSGLAPTALVLFFAFDPALVSPDTEYYETIARDALGDVVRDEDGEALVTRSAILPASELALAGKSLDAQIYAEGVIGIAISGINDDPIPSGTLFTIGFEAQPGINASLNTVIRGITAESSVVVTNPNTGEDETAFSSAAALDEGTEVPLNIAFFGGTMLFSCPGNTPAPTALTAGTDDPEAVNIGWNSSSALEYRVYRAASNNFGAALPLGAGWQLSRTFSDFSAAATIKNEDTGCFGPQGDTPVNQFYWVIARDEDGCESTVAGPVQGARAAEEAKELAAAAFAPTGDWAVFAFACGILLAAALVRRFISA